MASDELRALHPLIRTRQARDYTQQAPTAAQIDAILTAARWTGSSHNEQPWRFIVVRRRATLDALADAARPSTRGLATAPVAIAIVVPATEERQLWHAFDEGRAAERMLVAATILGLGGGISFTWVRPELRVALREILGVPPDRNVRTIVAIGHPSEAGLQPKSPPGEARNPHSTMVFEERWPDQLPGADGEV